MGIRWINKDAFFKRLLSVVPEAAQEMGKANSISADKLVADAKSLVAVKTGTLRDSIHKEPGKREGSFLVKAGGPTTTTVSANGEYDYALAVEHGTEDMQRQPFFYPSFRANKRPARDRVRRALVKAIVAKGFKTS